MKTKYDHITACKKQEIIKLTFKARKKYAEMYSGTVNEKPHYIAINDILIVDYNEYIDWLKNCKFNWCCLTRHISLNLEKINSVVCY